MVVLCPQNKSVVWYYNQIGYNVNLQRDMVDSALLYVSISLSLIISLANTLVIGAVLINQRFHQPTFCLLANLASVDLFSGISYLYLTLNSGPRAKHLTVAQWFLLQALLNISLNASLANIVVIAVERHRAVAWLHRQNVAVNMDSCHVAVLIVLTWTGSLIVGLLPNMGWNCLCEFPNNCSQLILLYSNSYLIFISLFCLAICCLTLFAYTHTFYFIHRKMQLLFHSSTQSTRDDMMQLMKTAVFVLSAFVLCWTPGLVVLLLDGVGCESCDVLKVEKYLLLLAELNSLFNPLIYSFRDNEMRQTFKHILCLPWRGATSFTTSHNRTHIQMHKVPSPSSAHSDSQGVNSSV